MAANANRSKQTYYDLLRGHLLRFVPSVNLPFSLDGRWRSSRFLRQLVVFVVLFLVDELVLQVAFSHDITIRAVYDLPAVVRGLVGRVASPDHTHVKC